MTAKRYLCVVYKARVVYFRIWVPSSLFTILPFKCEKSCEKRTGVMAGA